MTLIRNVAYQAAVISDQQYGVIAVDSCFHRHSNQVLIIRQPLGSFLITMPSTYMYLIRT